MLNDKTAGSVRPGRSHAGSGASAGTAAKGEEERDGILEVTSAAFPDTIACTLARVLDERRPPHQLSDQRPAERASSSSRLQKIDSLNADKGIAPGICAGF